MTRKEVRTPVQEYEAALGTRAELSAQLGDAPENLRPLLHRGLEFAEQKLASLATNAEVVTHFTSMGEEIQLEQERLEQAAEALESVGMKDAVDEERAKIADRASAVQYWMKLSGIKLKLNPEPSEQATTPPAPKKPLAKPAAKGEEGEAKKKTLLNIVVDPDHNIKINNRYVSMDRSVAMSLKLVGEERAAILRRVRVEVLEFLASNPDQKFGRTDIQKAVPYTEGLSRDIWKSQIHPFFKDDLKFRRQPIVSITRPSKDATWMYGISNFDINMEHSSQSQEKSDHVSLIGPDKKPVAGIFGQVLKMLDSADAENLVTLEDFYGEDKIYTPEEMKGLSKTPRDYFLTYMSRGRQWAARNGSKVIRVPTKDPESGKETSGFYMREATETEKINDAENKEDEPEVTELTLQEIAFLAVYLEHNSIVLSRNGLEPLPEGLSTDLNFIARQEYTNGHKTPRQLIEHRKDALSKAMLLLKDTEKACAIIDEYKRQDKPRHPVLEFLYHLVDYADKPDVEEFFAKLQDATSEQHTDMDMTTSGGGYIISGITRRVVTSSGERL